MLGVYLRGWAIISPINFSTVLISISISAAGALGRLQTDNGRGVRGGKVTGWTNTEEDAGGLTEVVLFLAGNMLRENDGSYSIGAEWALLC